MTPEYIEKLREMGACAEAIRWLKRRKFQTLQEAWEKCRRLEWMDWLMQETNVPTRHLTEGYSQRINCRKQTCLSCLRETGLVKTPVDLRKLFPKVPRLKR